MNKTMWTLGGLAVALPVGWWAYSRLLSRNAQGTGSASNTGASQFEPLVAIMVEPASVQDLSELSYMRRVSKGSPFPWTQSTGYDAPK